MSVEFHSTFSIKLFIMPHGVITVTPKNETFKNKFPEPEF